eukprot:GFYU01007578.1.p1 GENE.GFYU01007578.1~~GFYU01007578.1.p1  ORF type:complete len:466 (+),score=91.68 GFYU01007578.1:98-1495(+)
MADTDTEMGFYQYKLLKEAFVTGHTGGTPEELILLASLMPVASLFNQLGVSTMKHVAGYDVRQNGFNSFVFDYLSLVLPVMISFTYAEWTVPVIAGLLFTCAAMYTLTLSVTGKSLISFGSDEVMKSINETRKPFLSTYRSYMMIDTCIAILAVDFVFFPRRFVKTEEFGYSLMDVGVGCFILSNALVSPQASDKTLKMSYLRRIWTSLLTSMPQLALGFARLASVKAAEYQEHVSEYGVHWNFFFTLAFVSLFTVLFNIPATYSGRVGIAMVAVYQYFLSYEGLTDYVLHHPRITLIDANKEGIFSCIGYLALFLIGVTIGKRILSNHTRTQWMRFLLEIVVLVVLTGVLTYMCDTHIQRVSRRMTNLSYVMWMLFYNLFNILGFLVVDLIVTEPEPNAIIHGINRNQLATFLVANLLTGAVNVSMRTLFASDLTAFGIVNLYMVAVCGLGVVLNNFNVTLKFW